MIEDRTYPAKFKYLYAAQWVGLATVFWVLGRFVFELEFTIWEAFAYFADAVLIMSLVYVIPLKKSDDAQKEARGIDFYDGPIAENKVKKEPFFLGFKKVRKIFIDWDNDKSLEVLLKSTVYKSYLRDLLKDQATKAFFKRTKSKKAEQDFLKKLEFDQEAIEKQIKDKKKYTEAQIKKDMKALEEKTQEIMKAKTALIPFNEFKIKEISKEVKEKFKNLHLYYVEMYDEERFEDEEEGWNKVLIILPDVYEKVLKTEPGEGWYKGWQIGLKSCDVFWLKIFQVTDNMPALYLRFSDNMPEQEIDTFENLRAIALTYLQLKVMEKWIYHLSTIPERIKSENVRLTQKAESFREGFSYMIQDFANDNLIFSKFVKDIVQEKLKGEIEKYKRRSQIFFAVLILIAISGLISLIVFLTLMASGPGFIPPGNFTL